MGGVAQALSLPPDFGTGKNMVQLRVPCTSTALRVAHRNGHPSGPCFARAVVVAVRRQIIVWDIAKDEPLLATTKIDDLFHREPVTGVRVNDIVMYVHLSGLLPAHE